MIIVTGGAGFIGSNLVRALNRRGLDDVLVVDDLENGDKHRSLNALEFRDYVDYRDFSANLDRFGKEPIEAIFHQGACSDTMVHDGRYMLEVNYEYSKKLLAFALDRCPFLYASSASVYGNGDAGFREELACEDPLNVYAFSKYLFDQHVRKILPQAKTRVVGLRYFNVYGPQENHKDRMASVVFKFHGQIEESGKLQIFEGSDGFRRDFVFVDDCVAVNLHFFDQPHSKGAKGSSGIFNCGSGRAESFLDLARATALHYPEAEIVEIPFPEALAGKYQSYTQADLTRLRAAGYEAEFATLEEGVGAYVDLLKSTGGYFKREPKA